MPYRLPIGKIILHILVEVLSFDLRSKIWIHLILKLTDSNIGIWKLTTKKSIGTALNDQKEYWGKVKNIFSDIGELIGDIFKVAITKNYFENIIKLLRKSKESNLKPSVKKSPPAVFQNMFYLFSPFFT